MALAISDITEPLAIGNSVYGITGKIVDSAVATGFCQWVKGITGSMPLVVKLDERHAQIAFRPEQIAPMRRWLDQQIGGIMKSGETPSVQYELSPVINMWAAKYALPTVLAIFVGGAVLGYVVKRQRWL